MVGISDDNGRRTESGVQKAKNHHGRQTTQMLGVRRRVSDLVKRIWGMRSLAKRVGDVKPDYSIRLMVANRDEFDADVIPASLSQHEREE